MRKFKLGMCSRAVSLACVGALALGVSACGDDEKAGGAAADGGTGGAAVEVKEMTTLLSYQDSIIWTGYEVARNKFYPDLGIKPKTEASNGTAYTIQQLTAGKVPFAISGAADTIVANAQGHKLISIANINTDLFTIRATPESGVKSVADLKGKGLGITDLGGGEIPLVNAALKAAGLTPNKDVKLVVVGDGGPAAARALQKGTISAFAGAPNDMAGIEGAAGISLDSILDEKYSGIPSNEILVSPETLADPDKLGVAIKIAAGWFKGTLYAKDNPAEALKIICELVPADCRDQKVAQGFFDVALANEVAQAEKAGEHDPVKYQLIQEAIVGTDIEGATTEVDLEEIFTNDHIDEIRAAMESGA